MKPPTGKIEVTHVGGLTVVRDETGDWKMSHRTMQPSEFSSITGEQFELAATALSNAALVSHHAGRSVGALIDRESGGLCIVGAIEVATYQEIYTNDVGEHYLLTREEWFEGGVVTCDVAIWVMSRILGGVLCALCPAAVRNDPLPWETVTHFSDNHCAGPVNAERLLLTGAAYAETMAWRKRLPVQRRLAQLQPEGQIVEPVA
jgi:hypothetical protein